MHIDRSGDIGFMEAVVAFMAVTVVLTGFMGVLAVTTVDTADPTDMIEPGRLTGTIEAGEFVPGFTGYMEELVVSKGLSGVSVTVEVPGGFCSDPEPYVFGDMVGPLYGRTIPGTVTDDSGRVLPAVFEVMLCA